jgi:putative transcriptional regulator
MTAVCVGREEAERLTGREIKPMKIQHHLDDATLMSFAAGGLAEALSAVVAAHVALCPACSDKIRRMERIGGALFAGLAPTLMGREAPVMALRRSEAEVATAAPARVTAASEVPEPLTRLIGDTRLDALPWRRLGIGVWHHRLPSKTGDLRLLKVGPGRRMPEHGHGGSELTLMLRGSYTDETGRYAAGDVADLDDEIAHTPVADAETGCICLIASDKPARFKGLIPRLVQPLTGI